MNADDVTFFSVAMSAGAILSGFCCSFLAFRIQREAGYHRQPNTSPCEQPHDTAINLTHFTISLALLLLSTLITALAGVAYPLLVLAHLSVSASRLHVVSGLLAGMALLLGYFVVELVHYRVFRFLPSDRGEWKHELPFAVLALLVAGASALLPFCLPVHALSASSTLAPIAVRLEVQIPDCKNGVFSIVGEPKDVFTEMARNDCVSSRGLETVVHFLKDTTTTLEVHNGGALPLTTIDTVILFKLKDGRTVRREYRFNGSVAPLADGMLVASAAVNPVALRPESGYVRYAYFDQRRP